VTTLQAAIQALYPVGSIYINAAVSTNPATLLGFGTWTEFGAGRVLVGQNASDALFDTLEETGGSKDAIVVSHTHTTESAGSHNHFVVTNTYAGASSSAHNITSSNYIAAGTGSSGAFESYNLRATTTAADVGLSSSAGSHSHTVASAGSSGTNANIQPYITVKMWKRTA
jgi:hypothetical protein